MGHTVEGSKVQETKVLKQLKSGLSNSDYIHRNEDSRIFSYVKRLPTALVRFDLNTGTQVKYAALLFFPGREPNVRSTWESFKGSDGFDAKGMESALNSHDDLVIGRITESDTHLNAQFVGFLERVDRLLEKLNALGVESVDNEDVVTLING